MDGALARLAFLGGDTERTWQDETAFLAVTRKSWESQEDFSGQVLVLESDDLIVAADATLYARAELTRALATKGIAPDGFTPSHLVQAAYRAWGSDLAEHLLGDFAFIVWDRRERKLTAARDPLGMRVLYFAPVGDRIALASSARALAELTDRFEDLNLGCPGCSGRRIRLGQWHRHRVPRRRSRSRLATRSPGGRDAFGLGDSGIHPWRPAKRLPTRAKRRWSFGRSSARPQSSEWALEPMRSG